MESETLPDKLKRASALQAAIDTTKPLKKELDALKFEIMLAMIESGDDKKSPVDGYYALKVTTNTRVIADETAVKDWIASNEKSVEDYLTLDKTKVLALADEVMEADGEILPGIEMSSSDRVDIKATKGKK